MPPRRNQVKSEPTATRTDYSMNDDHSPSLSNQTNQSHQPPPMELQPTTGADKAAPAVRPKAPPPRRRVKDQSEDIIGGPQLKAKREPRPTAKPGQAGAANPSTMKVAFRGLARDGTSAANSRKQQMLAALDNDEKSRLDQMLDIDTNMMHFSDDSFGSDKRGGNRSTYKPVNLPFVSPSAPEWYEGWLDAVADPSSVAAVQLPAFLDPSLPPVETGQDTRIKTENSALGQSQLDLSRHTIPRIHSAAGWFLPQHYLEEKGIDLTPTPEYPVNMEDSQSLDGGAPVKNEFMASSSPSGSNVSNHVIDLSTNMYIPKDITADDSRLVLLQLPPYLNLSDLAELKKVHQELAELEATDDMPLTTSAILASTNSLQVSEEAGMYQNPMVRFYNANGSTIKAQDARDLGYIPRFYDVTSEGALGTLAVYASGRVVLTINGAQFEISKGPDTNMLANAVVIEPNPDYDEAAIEQFHYSTQQYVQQQQQRQHDPLLPEPDPVEPLAPEIARPLVATFLGSVSRHAVCTVDVDHMVASHLHAGVRSPSSS